MNVNSYLYSLHSSKHIELNIEPAERLKSITDLAAALGNSGSDSESRPCGKHFFFLFAPSNILNCLNPRFYGQIRTRGAEMEVRIRYNTLSKGTELSTMCISRMKNDADKGLVL